MMRKVKHISLGLLLLASLGAQAQLNPTLYHMKDLPLNNQLNPAFQPKNGSLYIGIPGLSSIYAEGLLRGDGLTAGNVYFKPNYGAIAMGESPFGAGVGKVDLNLLNFGFMVKDMYFTFDVNLRTYFEGRVPKDVERLMWYGNGADETLGKTLSMEGVNVMGYGYGEVALGFSKEILKDQLTVGAKAKFLMGGAYAQAYLKNGSSIYTDPNNYNITAGFNPEAYIAGLPLDMPGGQFTLDSLKFSTGNYQFKPENTGVAFDLGGSWDIPWVKGLNVSASALNIGFINWKGTKVTAVNPNAKFTFDGFDMSENGKDFANQLLDSLKQQTEVVSSAGTERKRLHPTIYAGANYELWKYLNVGALFGYQFGQFENLPMFALSANTQNFMVNLSASYSYFNSNHNVGVGVVFGRSGFQWHLIADNLLAINYESAQQLNFRMGFNVVVGKNKQERKAKMAKKLSGNSDAMAPAALSASEAPATVSADVKTEKASTPAVEDAAKTPVK